MTSASMPNRLPPASYRQPVVLVCGDALAELFGVPFDGALTTHLTAKGCYVAVPEVQHLPDTITELLAVRPDWRSQLSIMLVSNPQAHADTDILLLRLRALGYQLKRLRRRGLTLPVMMVSYLCSAHGQGPWFTWQQDEAEPQLHEAGTCLNVAHWQRQPADLAVRSQRLQACIPLNSAAAWLVQTLQPALAEQTTPAPVAWAITCVPTLGQSVPGNLWQQWLNKHTALHDPATPQATTLHRLPLPDAVLHLLPERSGASAANRRALRAVWLGTFIGLAAMGVSAWQNSALMRQVNDDLHHYRAMPEAQHRDQPEFDRRHEAWRRLRNHATRLERYDRNGAPLYLGLGLYQGHELRPPLREALDSYRPPAVATPAQAVVRLDGLSLFDHGSARLKPDSDKVLINALVGIKARPGWLIVIAGHTDSSGDPRSNIHLSRARAMAVRDWMQHMSDIADDCFAVQGFGASQPIDSNDTERGRAANRRVDIRLVLEPGGCALPPGTPATPVAHRDIQ